MKIHPIYSQNTLKNIFYIIEYGDKRAIVIDPCDAVLTQECVARNNLKLEKICITHEHYDHYDGVVGLECDEVYSSKIAADNMPISVTHIINDQEIFLKHNDLELKAVMSPGHAPGHMMFELSQSKNVLALFVGDTLFQGGVGRAGSGAISDLYYSVQKILSYPDSTILYVGHDYLGDNLSFIQQYAPEKYSRACKQYETHKNFTSLLQEKSINPFIGISQKEFTQLRNIKNNL